MAEGPTTRDREPVVLNGRYELHSRIARGGMAEVFLARDQVLDRAVAVKVLFPEYAADPAFVERFRREAQSAANLNHPSIVGVYDWGSYRGTYFIVMEYVRGRSLAEILRAEGTLHPDRAADIATDIAGGLYFAHRNGVVHRDIKPGNVLITPQGQVKVTDFGIARAVGGGNTDNLTQTGSVMGTATYFSPEQAQGLPVDPRSDLYSLGVVLYEMLCGRPPFSGDSPVAIAYQHVQASATPPRQVNPAIPPALEAITLKLLAKNPANRYPTAEEVRADLRRFREGLAVAAEPVLDGPVPLAVPSASQQALNATGVLPAGRTTALPRQAPADPTSVGPIYAGAPIYEPPKRNGIFIGVLVVLLALLGVLLFLFARTLLGTGSTPTTPKTIAVPDVVNKAQSEAEALLRKEGFQATVEFEASALAPGLVIRQDPAAKTLRRVDQPVTIFVSLKDTQLDVPSVVGKTEAQARADLSAAGFTKIDKQTRSTTEKDKKGIVIDQSPQAKAKAAKDQTITIVVGTGPEELTLPAVAGKTYDQAVNLLVAAGVLSENIQRVPTASSDVAVDKVIGTEPSGKVTTDQVVQVLVSSGPDKVDVPEVTGLTQEGAERELQSAGFKVSVKTKEGRSADVGRVIDQSPDASKKADRGSTVQIVVGTGTTTTSTSAPTTTDTTTTTTTTTTDSSTSTTKK